MAPFEGLLSIAAQADGDEHCAVVRESPPSFICFEGQRQESVGRRRSARALTDCSSAFAAIGFLSRQRL